MRKYAVALGVFVILSVTAVYAFLEFYSISPAATEVYSRRTVKDAMGISKNIALRMDIYPGDASAGPRIPVILMGGGGWSLGRPQRDAVDRWIALLRDNRFRVFSVEYRSVDCGVFGAMAGVKPEHSCFPHPARVEDLDAAVAYISANAARLGVDPARTILLGDSSGGHSVGLYALRASHPACKDLLTCGKPVAGVVSFAGPLDLQGTLTLNPSFKILVARLLHVEPPVLDRALKGIGPESAMLHDADPMVHMHAGMPPFLLLHSRADFFVPNQVSRSFRNEARLLAAGSPMTCGETTYDPVHKLPLPDSVQPTSHAAFYSMLGVSRLTYLESLLPSTIVDLLFRGQQLAGLGETRQMGLLVPPATSVQMRRDLSALSRQMRDWMACRARAVSPQAASL